MVICWMNWMPWDDSIVLSASKMRKLWDSLSELRSSLWKTTGKDSSEACAIACQNCTVYSVSPSGMISHTKIAQFNWECIGCFTGCQSPHGTSNSLTATSFQFATSWLPRHWKLSQLLVEHKCSTTQWSVICVHNVTEQAECTWWTVQLAELLITVSLIEYIYIYISSPYRAVNTLCLGYKNQSVHIV